MRFFLIDRITNWEIPAAAEAIKNVALSEDFFDDHFPRRPIMPGVLMLRAWRNCRACCWRRAFRRTFQRNAKAILTVLERTKFRQLVRPGDTLAYRAEVASVNPDGGKVVGSGVRGGELVATTGMVFAFKYVDDPLLEARRAALLKTWMQSVQ